MAFTGISDREKVERMRERMNTILWTEKELPYLTQYRGGTEMETVQGHIHGEVMQPYTDTRSDMMQSAEIVRNVNSGTVAESKDYHDGLERRIMKRLGGYIGEDKVTSIKLDDEARNMLAEIAAGLVANPLTKQEEEYVRNLIKTDPLVRGGSITTILEAALKYSPLIASALAIGVRGIQTGLQYKQAKRKEKLDPVVLKQAELNVERTKQAIEREQKNIEDREKNLVRKEKFEKGIPEDVLKLFKEIAIKS